MLVSLSLSFSKIPKHLVVIKEMVSKTIDNLTLMASVNDKIVLSLKRIETKDVNYIKAVGMVQLEKSFIISAFGAFFFYVKDANYEH